MKKTFANLVQKSLMVALLVVGALLFGTSRAEAQDLSQFGGNWVDASEAKARLITELGLLHTDPLVQTVGSDSYIRTHYYKAVFQRIDGGETVPNAVIFGIGPVNAATESLAVTVPGVTLSPAQRSSYVADLAGRLTQ
jgi:hypothetical protein